MITWLKEKIIKSFVVNLVIKQLDAALKKMPLNDSKMVTGILVTCLGLVIGDLPASSEYIQPLIDFLKTLPASEITGSGIALGIVGGFHKILKFIIALFNNKDEVKKEG